MVERLPPPPMNLGIYVLIPEEGVLAFHYLTYCPGTRPFPESGAGLAATSRSLPPDSVPQVPGVHSCTVVFVCNLRIRI